MPYSFPDRIPQVAMHWSPAEQKKCTEAAAAVLRDNPNGGKKVEAQAIFACIRAAGRSTKKSEDDTVKTLDKIYLLNGEPVKLRELVRAYVQKRDFDPNVGGGVDRDKLKSSDFVFGDERKFPVVTSGDVMDAVHSWGRYKGPHTFEEFKSRLTALCHRKGFALPKSWGVEKSEDEKTIVVDILKADEERRLVYGAVLKPGIKDSQGDKSTEKEVELAAHRFLKSKISGVAMDEEHERDVTTDEACPVESYITQDVMKMGDKELPKGTWIMAAHVPDDEMWEKVKKHEINGFSVKGWGKRKKILRVSA